MNANVLAVRTVENIVLTWLVTREVVRAMTRGDRAPALNAGGTAREELTAEITEQDEAGRRGDRDVPRQRGMRSEVLRHRGLRRRHCRNGLVVIERLIRSGRHRRDGYKMAMQTIPACRWHAVGLECCADGVRCGVDGDSGNGQSITHAMRRRGDRHEQQCDDRCCQPKQPAHCCVSHFHEHYYPCATATVLDLNQTTTAIAARLRLPALKTLRRSARAPVAQAGVITAVARSNKRLARQTDYLTRSNCITVYAPSTLSATKLILSPAFT